ncbi:MAG: hypothetical protein HZB66_02925 [Candidatus Aenigmarchaeota archaeon]|nr:hypothetical protein [Candidatus Aenigmarchaeota archaeon]
MGYRTLTRRRFLYWLTAASAGLGLSYGEDEKGIDLIEDIEWKPHLEVRKASKRTGIKGSEKDGIEDMKTLSLIADEEAGWIYLKDANVWIKTGVNASFKKSLAKDYGLTDTKGGFGLDHDMNYIDAVLLKNRGVLKSITVWHMHPKKTEDICVSHETGSDSNKSTKAESNSIRFKKSLVCAMPSQLDIAQGIRTTAWASTPPYDCPDYSEAVCSPYGAFRLSLTAAGKSEFCSLNPKKIGAHTLNMWKSVEGLLRLPDSLEAEDLDSTKITEYRLKTFREIASKLSTEYAKAEFIE